MNNNVYYRFIVFVLLLLLISLTQCLKTNELSSSRSKSLIQTNLKLRTLSNYLHEYSQLAVSLNEIVNKTTLYAYYNRTSKQISIHSTVINDQPNVTPQVLVAKATYEQQRFKTGWDTFTSETFNTTNPIIQCYAVGILEGLLSYREIHSYRHNFEYFFNSNEDITELKKLFKQADENIKHKIESFGYTSNFIPKIEDIKSISYLSCLHAQINGLYQGYSLISPSNMKLDLYDLYLLNSEGYFSGLQAYLKVNNIQFKSTNDFFNNKTLLEFYNTTHIEDIWKHLIHRSHCSGIVKYITNPLKGNDVILGHNTWTGYNELLRVLKKVHYAFEGNSLLIGMKPINMKYSSYPGVLFSGDEFYALNSNVAVIQTSLSIINYFQYKNAINVNTYIPEFMRIMIINFLSKSGKEWVDNYLSLFKGNHLYETQWIVVDYNKLNSDKELMYIVEEVPKSVKYVDYTRELKDKGYYGSFNVPYFKDEHADIAGLKSFKDVDFYNQKYNPRQFILDKLVNKVKDINTFKDLLMYNGYHVKQKEFNDDPSYNDASNGIASREGAGSGAIDFKIVNKELMRNGVVWVYSGPVYDSNKNFKPYDVSKAEKRLQKYSVGMPMVWDFKPFYFK